MAQIRQVVSESLQATIRRLLPSQQGFTEDLQASNVIQPIIDLTPSAEGRALPVELQESVAFGSQTAFDISNTTVVIANTPGFYRIFGTVCIRQSSTGNQVANFTMSDGLSVKKVWGIEMLGSSALQPNTVSFDFNVFLAAGESISGVSGGTNSHIIGSSRQIADVNANLVNPNGFSFS